MNVTAIHASNCVAKSKRPLDVDGVNYGFTQRCTVGGRWHYVAFGRRYTGEVVSYTPVLAAKTRAEAVEEARALIAAKRW